MRLTQLVHTTCARSPHSNYYDSHSPLVLLHKRKHVYQMVVYLTITRTTHVHNTSRQGVSYTARQAHPHRPHMPSRQVYMLLLSCSSVAGGPTLQAHHLSPTIALQTLLLLACVHWICKVLAKLLDVDHLTILKCDRHAHTYVHTDIHNGENRSLFQSLTLMHSAIITVILCVPPHGEINTVIQNCRLCGSKGTYM